MQLLKKQILFFLTFLLITTSNLLAQVTQGNSTQGTDFWMSFGANMPTLSPVLQIKIAALETAIINIEFTNDPSVNVMNQTITAGSIYALILSPAQRTAANSMGTGIGNKSVHITSNKNVSVYALNQRSASAEATNILPTNNLGIEYYQISYKPTNNRGNQTDGYTIVATQDNTNIFVDGSSIPQNSTPLNAGDVYSYYWPPHSVDGTGTHITSNNPVAYFVTNTLTYVPMVGYTSGADCLYEQLPPVNLWGNKFLVPQTTQKVGRIRILASQNGTIIDQTGATGYAASPATTNTVTPPASSYSLDAGQFIELEIEVNGCYISANKPVGVCAYMVTGSYKTGLPASLAGDPAIAWIPPIEQSLENIVIAPFIISAGSNLAYHYALIVTSTATKDQTTVAIGTNVPTALGISWTDNAVSGYSFGSLELTQNDTYLFANPKGIVISGYGTGNIESYYYVAGSASRDLTAYYTINDYYYTEIAGGQLCNPYHFQSFINYPTISSADSIRWYIDDFLQTNLTNRMEWNWETGWNGIGKRMPTIHLRWVCIHSGCR